MGAKNRLYPQPIIKHIIKEASRSHVTWWDSHGTHCTEKDCEINHTPMTGPNNGS